MSPVFSPARPSASARRLGLLGGLLGLTVAGLTGCYEHHTADEELLESSVTSQDAGTSTGSSDGGVAADAGSDPCGDIADTDVLGQILCDFTSGGATGSLGTPSNSQCRNVNPDDFATQALCAAGALTGSSQTGGLDLGTLASLAGLLTGGQTGTTGSNANGLTDILNLLGGLGGQTGTTGTTGGAGTTPDLGALLGLLGGLNGQAGTGNTGTRTGNTAGN